MIQKCSNEIIEEYKQIRTENRDSLEIVGMSEPVNAITNLIGDYEAYKQLLIEQEYEYEKQLIDYENELFLLKAEYMSSGLKSTEAKENAKSALIEKKEKMLKIERDINMLKACVHSTEYKLRLKFKQINENEFQPSIQDILEAR